MALILTTLADRDGQTIADICKEHGLSRSTAFQVAGKLLAAGFLTRHGKGRLTLGPEAVRLGYARSNLGSLAGPAEATLSWLRNQTGGEVALLACDQPADRLVSIPDRDFDSDIELLVCNKAGRPVALLQFQHRSAATRIDRAYAIRCCERAVKTLETYLQAPGDANR